MICDCEIYHTQCELNPRCNIFLDRLAREIVLKNYDLTTVQVQFQLSDYKMYLLMNILRDEYGIILY